MKTHRIATSLFLSVFLFLSCQREKSFESKIHQSTGFLKEAGGDCLGNIVAGIYQEDSVLNRTNYVDVEVNVTSVGTYSIKTDTLNGMYFKDSSVFLKTGLDTVRLKGFGTALSAGIEIFTVTYNSTACSFPVTTIPGVGSIAEFTLAGSPGNCTPTTIAGNYTAGSALDNSNTVTIQVDVTKKGAYSIATSTVNGMTFFTSGAFATTGVQPVILKGSGTPQTAGMNVFTPQAGPSGCTFSITVNTPVPAIYTFSGAPGNCSNTTVNGIYSLNTALTTSNTVTIQANVTAIGGYSISTTTAGGMTFSKTGVFTSTGVQSIVLNGSGTPTNSGASMFTPQSAGVTGCTFSVNVLGAAVYTFSGAGGACTGAVINGTYTTGVALTTSNTATIQVNVTAPGTYAITTNTAGGMVFSKSGAFTNTGLQSVVLTGSGTPSTSGVNTFQTAASGCTFDVNVGTAPSGTFSCKIDGVLKTFNDRAAAKTLDDFFTPPTPYLYLDGYTDPPNGSNVPELQIFIEKNNSSAVMPGTYNEKAFLQTNGYRIEIDYSEVNPDLSVTIWNTSSSVLSTNPPFTIIITSVSASRVKGTFSGTITNTLQGSTVNRTVTEGVFDLPIVN